MHRVVIPFAFSFLLLAGCGGQTEGSASDGGVASDGSTNAGDGGPSTAWSPSCPTDAPTQGAACTNEGLNCEYGCGNVLTCADGAWDGATLIGGAGPCDEDAGANAASCPAALSAIPSNGSCSNAGIRCIYSGGYCECDSPQDPTPDAGSTWQCGPQAGCPSARPRIGSGCDAPGEECDYSQCGGHENCTDGAWQPAAGGGCGG